MNLLQYKAAITKHRALEALCRRDRREPAGQEVEEIYREMDLNPCVVEAPAFGPCTLHLAGGAGQLLPEVICGSLQVTRLVIDLYWEQCAAVPA